MHKNFKKSFENERKIERRSFVTERERKTNEKLSASSAQNFRLSAERESASNFFERTKALDWSEGVTKPICILSRIQIKMNFLETFLIKNCDRNPCFLQHYV